MADSIGVRELKNQTSRVIPSVREELAGYVVTLRGEPVAILRPLSEEEIHQLRQSEIEETLEVIRSLAQVVAAAWVSARSGIELVAEQRR